MLTLARVGCLMVVLLSRAVGAQAQTSAQSESATSLMSGRVTINGKPARQAPVVLEPDNSPDQTAPPPEGHHR